MRIERDIKLDYADVLFRPKRSTIGSRKEVKLERTYTFRNVNPDPLAEDTGTDFTGIPIMAANMDGVGSISMANALAKEGMFTCLAKSIPTELLNSIDDWRYTAISTGITDKDYQNIQLKLRSWKKVKYICIDVANGYSERFLDFVSKFREEFPDKVIIAGNVVTPDMTEELLLRGADIVKVGIGPGSVCTTRIKTGVGYPQLSAVIECADAAHGLGGHIIADGGCSSPGDVAKAFGAGADFVMLGGMLAGSYECEGDWQYEWVSDGKHDYHHKMVRTSLKFYGMSSSEAQSKYGGVKDYRASEGRVKEVPYKGPVKDIILDVLGGLRSACAYMGATKLKDMNKCAEFNLVNRTHFDQSTQ